VETTGEFTANKPDPKLSADRQVAGTAFQLTREEPNSDVIEVPDGYYILHLADATPARPLTMEEAKPKIVDSLKASRAREAMSLKASAAVHDLREGLKAGEPLSFAAEKVNLKAEKIPTFTLMDDENQDPNKPQEKKPDMIAVKNAVASLQPGEVSDFFPWEDGGIIAVLEKRDPPDEAKYGPKKKELAERIQTNKREIAFYEWLREKQREAGILRSQPDKPS
jgi:parvulin-like peptidyl-prolyl isomerase